MSDIKKVVDYFKIGILYIRCTRRNVFCSLVAPGDRRVISSYSLGISEVSQEALDPKNNYLRSKILGQHFLQKVKELGISELSIIVRGLGPGRAALLNIIRGSNLTIHNIEDTTLIPHNGCRSPKQRRKKLRTRLSFKTKRLLTPGS